MNKQVEKPQKSRNLPILIGALTSLVVFYIAGEMTGGYLCAARDFLSILKYEGLIGSSLLFVAPQLILGSLAGLVARAVFEKSAIFVTLLLSTIVGIGWSYIFSVVIQC